MGIVFIQQSARKIRTIMEKEIETAYIPSLVKKCNKMLIFLKSSFNLKAVDLTIVGSANELDPVALRYLTLLL
jgi:hypothetical protein